MIGFELRRFVAVLVALAGFGCGGESESEAPVCRNAWREIRIPEEFSDFQAAAASFYEGRLYVFKGVLVEPVIDPFPNQPIGLVYEPPNAFRAISSEGALELLPGIDLIMPIGNELLLAGQAMYDPGWETRYDIVNDRWLDAHSADAPPGTNRETVAAMGDELLKIIQHSDENGEPESFDYYAYGPKTGFRTITPPPTPNLWLWGIWTGQQTILWGEYSDETSVEGEALRYEPDSDTWPSVSLPGPPSLARGGPGVWTGTELVLADGRYSPDLDAWEPVSAEGAVSGQQTAVGRRVVTWWMGWPDPNDASGAVYDAALDRWGPPMSTRCLGRPSNRWVQTWADDGLLVWISYGREEPDRLVFLAAESVFGELPEDPAECRCPSRVGEE